MIDGTTEERLEMTTRKTFVAPVLTEEADLAALTLGVRISGDQ